jgi:hypothetical protein
VSGTTRPVTAADLVVGDPVWVWSFGRWRRGEVTAVARVRVRVRYDASSPGGTRHRWFAANADEPVYPGRLSAPVQARCADPACRQPIIGRPGQSQGQAQAGHEASAAHRTSAPRPPVAGPSTAVVLAAAAGVDELDVVWIATPRRGIAAHGLAAAGEAGADRGTDCGRVVVHDGRGYGHILTAAYALARYQVHWCPRCWPHGRA